MFAHIVLGLMFIERAAASPNGKLFACDTEKLSSDKQCFFVATSDNSIGASKHVFNLNVAPDGQRKVVDNDGNDLPVTPKPWGQGVTLAASTNGTLAADLVLYAQAFELIAPLRNKMMYAPETLKDLAEWQKYTKALKDCQIKKEYVDGDHGGEPSMDTVYADLKDNQGKDNHHTVLRFLEEGAIDLVCVMIASLPMSRCDTIRKTVGVCQSDCWVAAYNALYSKSVTATCKCDTAITCGDSCDTAAKCGTTPAKSATTSGVTRDLNMAWWVILGGALSYWF